MKSIKSFFSKQGVALAAFCAVALCGTAQADNVLWYNGDLDYITGLVSTDSGNPSANTGIVYDDFNVTSPTGWNVNSVFGNYYFKSDAVSTTADWEIRSGVSDGNGGTLVASGTTTADVVQTGVFRSYTVQEVTVSGLNLVLSPGTYWLGLQPSTPGSAGFLGSTSGDNSVGSPGGTNGNSYYTRPDMGYSFTSTDTIPATPGHDYSLGVTGTEVVPEPSTWMLILAGLILMGLRSRISPESLTRLTCLAPSPRR